MKIRYTLIMLTLFLVLEACSIPTFPGDIEVKIGILW